MYDMFRNSKVLVAGGAGFVGVNLITRLLELGASITATLHNKPAVINDKRIRYLKCDLTKTEDCAQAVKDADYVFMCAANTSGADVMEKSPLAHVTPNVVMNTLMLEAAYEAGVQKFLFISSNIDISIFDGRMGNIQITGLIPVIIRCHETFETDTGLIRIVIRNRQK